MNETWQFDLGDYETAVRDAAMHMRADDVLGRMAAHDHTLWKPEPTEITNRLGWLDIAARMVDNVPAMQALADEVRGEGYTDVLLLGMGGSSLAPEVFAKAFGESNQGLSLKVLDSTHPDAVLAHASRLNPAKTLFVVSTKSGGTVETLSFFKYFYNWVAEQTGVEAAGQHFVAVTDPGSRLTTLAEQYGFRATWINDPNIGGRYSVLSYFGLLPAILVGLDVQRLLQRAQAADRQAASELGAAMAVLASQGRDKLTLVASPAIDSFGDWVEQLVAESLGKEGKGILPVVGEPLGEPAVYGGDRFFVYLRLAGDDTHDTAMAVLRDAGHPVVQLDLRDLYDLGAQFSLWEIATAVAGHLMQVNPFDQPNVESAKRRAKEMIAAYQAAGTLPAAAPAFEAKGILVYGDMAAETLAAALERFLTRASRVVPVSYVAIQAYIQPAVKADAALRGLQTRLRNRTKLATTVGYGPRFLHSTGQLHKGDAGNGLFIQITSDAEQDVAIPDEAGQDSSSLSFGVLVKAQALGDEQALKDEHRQVIRFHLGTDTVAGIERLIGVLA